MMTIDFLQDWLDVNTGKTVVDEGLDDVDIHDFDGVCSATPSGSEYTFSAVTTAAEVNDLAGSGEWFALEQQGVHRLVKTVDA